MVSKMTILVVNFVMFYMFNLICRYNACYFNKAKINKYIIIKNKIVAKILIGRAVGRDKIVKTCDLDKMSIVGLISYIIIFPINLFYLILKIIIVLNYNEFGNLSSLSNFIYFILAILTILNLIILLINTWNCSK
jgi:hypothetical protein